LARANPCLIASSKPFFEVALISDTLATGMVPPLRPFCHRWSAIFLSANANKS
jgi:hypothetical protein